MQMRSRGYLLVAGDTSVVYMCVCSVLQWTYARGLSVSSVASRLCPVLPIICSFNIFVVYCSNFIY